ncbi:MAG: hypothetical protein JXR63_09385 [Spirochaetales bacterium]|nr:hypothetical protein [Spirochaetales bacterium]
MTRQIKILGEIEVDDPVEFAGRLAAEAEAIISSDDWRRKIKTRSGEIYAAKAVGDFSSTGIKIMMLRMRIAGDASRLFDFLTSVEGFRLLDPISAPQNHAAKPVMDYGAEPGRRRELARTTAKIKFFPEIEFLVFNSIDTTTLTFVSKSVTHPACPGASRYSATGSSNTHRAFNTFIIQLDPASQALTCINYLDLGIKLFPAWLYNLINLWYLRGIGRKVRQMKKTV